MVSSNIKMLQTVASGLGDLNKRVVFVGGVVAELYADDPGASEIRATQDVDCVIELTTRKMHAEFEEELRKREFVNDTSKGAPICRWTYKNIKVDIMPAADEVLGFSNRWYASGFQNKITKDLPDGTQIFILSPQYYIATKFEAHKSRGGDDLRQSHDFEDIIYIMDNCTEVVDIIKGSNSDIKEYLKLEAGKLIEYSGINEGVECALPYGSDSD
ncbi:MAG: hypothetical protein GT600_17065, partial [Bacteroidales bacterium]|nr:hypothetical protein [Bacteroidales bacterium]